MDIDFLEESIVATVEALLQELADGKYTYYRVSKYSGMSAASIKRLVDGATTIEKITTESMFGLCRFYEMEHGSIIIVKEDTVSDKIRL